MRIFYELLCTVIIEIVWTSYLKSVPATFQKYSKHISWVISGTSSSKQSCNPRHPSRNISCNHRHHLLQPSWRRIFSTSKRQKSRVDSDINSDYKASSFPQTIYPAQKNETQRALLGHTNRNIEMRSPSAAAMLTMVAAATIVRLPPSVLKGHPDFVFYHLPPTFAHQYNSTQSPPSPTVWRNRFQDIASIRHLEIPMLLFPSYRERRRCIKHLNYFPQAMYNVYNKHTYIHTYAHTYTCIYIYNNAPMNYGAAPPKPKIFKCLHLSFPTNISIWTHRLPQAHQQDRISCEANRSPGSQCWGNYPKTLSGGQSI